MGHLLYEKINKLDTDNITIFNTLKCKNVKINDYENENNSNYEFFIIDCVGFLCL